MAQAIILPDKKTCGKCGDPVFEGGSRIMRCPCSECRGEFCGGRNCAKNDLEAPGRNIVICPHCGERLELPGTRS